MRMNNWNAIAARRGESVPGANTTAITMIIATIATEAANKGRQEFGGE